MRYEDVHAEIDAGTARDVLPHWARGLLDDIAHGRRVTAAVRHPLGFLCLPVERRGPYGMCLHLWSAELPAGRVTTSQVHCHSWDLVSYVLYGSLRNVRFQIVDDPAAATHRVFEVISRGDVDELRATDRTVRCAPGRDSMHRTGESYALPAGVFHSTVLDDGPEAATVALGLEVPAAGDLSLGGLGTPTHRVHRLPHGPAETARAALLSSRRIAAVHAD
ncbi:hypothetical protein DPM19_06170 [Actinomadura craniellae]|uniref:Cysteine dioxygenase n=1 Tax=Actinomadura craniellae TaxID=2231787 RepID=A0A365HDX1_9ACTN|nr:hypothetical protein [Actinomadura craniellae]RAY16453.1 hypothetical protein DPM19_06170 [Actinomadura craniellae]